MNFRIGSDNPGYSLERARYGGGGPVRVVDRNTIETPRYTIDLTNSRSDHAVTITDKLTGKCEKKPLDQVFVGGDPHLATSDGDFTSFQHRNVTLNLDDGTKVTFDPTNNPGPTYLERVTITNGNDAAVVNFDANGNPTVQSRPGEGYKLDDRTRDGLDLRTNGSLDDLKVVGGREINGRNIENLDNLRDIDDRRRDQHAFFDRPHIGLPGWRHDGPYGHGDFWRQDHHVGRHDHDHGRHDNDCHGPGDCGPHGGKIRDLQAQLHYFRHIGDYDRVHQIERQLHRLRADLPA